jgi:hypothetical protein
MLCSSKPRRLGFEGNLHPNNIIIRSKCAYTYLPFLMQGLGLCVVYNEILRLGFLLVVVWFLIVYMHRATIVYVIDIELQASR